MRYALLVGLSSPLMACKFFVEKYDENMEKPRPDEHFL
jgi:hypothetical protein